VSEQVANSAVVDETGEVWNGIMAQMLANSSRIVALRGAGSFNGISITDAQIILEDYLFPRMERLLRDGKVSVIYDGDDDDREYPDIGYIMGRLAERFSGEADFYAVQKLGWYRYQDDLPALKPLHSAGGVEYRTDRSVSG
jgi:hypothetical protein